MLIAKASRVLITSRTHNIPRDAQFVHKLDGLDSQNSWELFLQVALNDNSEGKCPPELESIGRDIVKKCKGLPLAIVVIGGLLLEQGPIVTRWEKVSRGVTSYFRGSKDSVGAILELSYHDLPPHLKACFLCLSFFREDAEIFAPLLVRVWIVEGFVAEGEMTMEEIGMSYLDELINRNMVQVDNLYSSGEVRSCQMHDLLRDLSIIKAKEEIKFDIVREVNAQGAMDKVRHIAIYSENEMLTLFRSPRSHVRSLFFHKSADSGDDISYRDDFWRNFDGLRVLSLDRMGLTIIPKMIGRLIGLRFLSLFDNNIHQLPKSIGRLKNLQTLYIFANKEMEVPNVLWKLDSLRHLCMENDIICEVPLKLDTLKNLQTISVISIKSIVVEHLKELINLRYLHVRLVLDTDVRGFFNSLSMLKNLAFLKLDWDDGDGCISLDGIQNLKHLTQLYIDGPLEKLPNELPPSISELKLFGTKLSEDSMLVLERLPKLSHLGIIDAYMGEEMVIRENGFPCLRGLEFHFMDELRKLHIQSGPLSNLEQLSLVYCSKLEIVPKEEELRIMRNLQKLEIDDPSKEISDKLKSVNYSDALSNIPSVQISHDHWAGDPSGE